MNYLAYGEKGKKFKIKESPSEGMKEPHAAPEPQVADPCTRTFQALNSNNRFEK